MTTDTKAKTPAPAPKASEAPASTEVPSSSRRLYAEVLRNFSGLQAGEIVDATDWRHTSSLVESRHVVLVEKEQVAASVPCPACRKRWVDVATRDGHDCTDLDADE